MENLVYIPLLLLCIAPALFALARYNTLVARRNAARAAWPALEAALRRRLDLTADLPGSPRLDELRRLCAHHPGPVSARAALENELSAVVRHLLIVDAGSHASLAAAEAEISAAQTRYNAAVHTYRARRESFSGRFLAQIFALGPMATFDFVPATA